jgi:hypothetical protein
MWTMLRMGALMRHRMLWMSCGCNPATWPAHKDIIRAFYGW